MYNEKMINSALVYAYQSGYNVVFIQVRGRGYSFYDSEIVPKHPKVDPDFDPLEYAVEFIDDDELVEITPKSLRIRKRHLIEHERKRAAKSD